ncbi:MAG TPA: amidohydrolase [Streptosporangiaceae bacterium]
MHTDIHQHVWPGPLIEELRRRTRPPRLDGWTLHIAGEPPFAVDPADHDVPRRAALAARDGTGLAVVGLSSPLGIEYLDPADAGPLLRAYHHGVAGLGETFAGWAAACLTEIDAPGLAWLLDQGFAGLQLPATALADEAGYRWCAPLLDVLAGRDRPLFIHPGPAGAADGRGPGWWAAVVPYVQQMHAAWFAFRAWGRPAYPRLRVCFTALAGLAPLHGERLAARGGTDPLTRGIIDPGMFVETSSYGHRAVDAVLRVLGVDALVLGSDRPYAEPLPAAGLSAAVHHAIRVANPARLLHGDPAPPRNPLLPSDQSPQLSKPWRGQRPRFGRRPQDAGV